MPEAAMPPCGSSHVLKLVINSHVAYNVPLRTLLISLLHSGFDRYGDVLLMLGGSPQDALPALTPISELLPGLASEHRRVVVVRTRNNGFDYHGLSLLYQHRGHPLVAADTYVYFHDTTTVDPDTFVERFEAFRLKRSPLLFTTWPLPNSNIVAFGAGVVHKYGNNFDGNLTKVEAFPMEFGYPQKVVSASGPVFVGS